MFAYLQLYIRALPFYVFPDQHLTNQVRDSTAANIFGKPKQVFLAKVYAEVELEIYTQKLCFSSILNHIHRTKANKQVEKPAYVLNFGATVYVQIVPPPLFSRFAT